MRWFRPRDAAGDVVAGASTALVLVPQSLAYAELAGVPAYYGLFAAAVAPLAASLLASSPYLSTGPAAMTSLLTAGALGGLVGTGFDPIALASLLALGVGIFRVVLGLCRGGALTFFLSPQVLQGFAVGAGILIVSSQIPTALGTSGAGDGVLLDAMGALASPARWRLDALVLTALTVALVLGGRKIHALFPGVLVAAAGGILYSVFGDYGGAQVGAVPDGALELHLDLPWEAWSDLLLPALVIAILGFAEPTAIARTYAVAERKPWNANRELMAQGAANVASGLVSGIPVGASFSRSALNRLAGARTRFSGAVAGAIALGFLFFASMIEPLPRPVLAAIIIAAAVGLLRFGRLLALWRYSRPQAGIAWVTFGLTLVTSPRIELAVLAGLILSIAVHAWREMRVRILISERDGELCLAPKGVLWFASAEKLQARFLDELARHPTAERLVIDLAGLGRIDYTGAVALREIGERARAASLDVRFANAPPQTERILGKVCPTLFDRDEAG